MKVSTEEFNVFVADNLFQFIKETYTNNEQPIDYIPALNLTLIFKKADIEEALYFLKLLNNEYDVRTFTDSFRILKTF